MLTLRAARPQMRANAPSFRRGEGGIDRPMRGSDSFYLGSRHISLTLSSRPLDDARGRLRRRIEGRGESNASRRGAPFDPPCPVGSNLRYGPFGPALDEAETGFSATPYQSGSTRSGGPVQGARNPRGRHSFIRTAPMGVLKKPSSLEFTTASSRVGA